MEFNLREQALKTPLIAAHREVSGGNIPCNTLDAFDAALYRGADMVELDVASSMDGRLFVFHPGMESAHLGQSEANPGNDRSRGGNAGILESGQWPSGRKINLRTTRNPPYPMDRKVPCFHIAQKTGRLKLRLGQFADDFAGIAHG